MHSRGDHTPALPALEKGPPFDPKGATFLEAVMLGVGDALAGDERAFVYGQDVGGKYGNAFLLLRPLLDVFGDRHPYCRIGTGTESSMESITLDDVRRFSEKNFTPANATLVAVGDTNVDDLRTRVSRHLGPWSGSAPGDAAIPEPPARNERVVYLVDKPGDSQSTISIAQIGIPRNHPDWERVFVPNRVLGGFFSSRLNLNLREDKGYTYGVRSSTSPKIGVSVFRMWGRVQTEVTAPALVEFLKELEGVGGKVPITQDELEEFLTLVAYEHI